MDISADVLVAVTRGGVIRARDLLSDPASRMPQAHLLIPEKFGSLATGPANGVTCYTGPLRARIGALFSHYDRIVFFLSLGAVVRLIGPHLGSKYRDPAVVVVDDAGRFVIPVLSGHVGGANDLARQLAERLGATAVITTASDVNNTLSVDILGRGLGWKVEASKTTLTRVAAHVVNGEPVAFVQEAGSRDWWPSDTPLPSNIRLFGGIGEVDLDKFPAVLWVTHREVDETLKRRLPERLVVYRPPESKIMIGIGCDRGTPQHTLEVALDRALGIAGRTRAAVAGLASIDRKSDEPGLLALSAQHGWPIHFYPAARLSAVTVPNPSETVRKYMGTPAVSEAAAMLAAGTDVAGLLLEKHKYRDEGGKNVTVSLARIGRKGGSPGNDR